jgi:hypothetical protein
MWLDSLSLLVTAAAVQPSADASRAAVAVGTLTVAVLAAGNLTSLDGTSAASNATAVVSGGSWGDAVCGGGVVVYSHSALVVAFEPPANASFVPSSYSIQLSTSSEFPPGASTRSVVVTPSGTTAPALALPPPLSATSLHYVVAGLATGTPYYTRVGVTPPALPTEVTSVLPQAVPVVFSPLGEPGEGCSCASSLVGPTCPTLSSGGAAAVTPHRPVIGECCSLDAGCCLCLLPLLTREALAS